MISGVPRVRGIRADSYRQHRFRKNNGHNISISTLDFNGVLDVIDHHAFCQTLIDGIGSARGFGCGLMMVRRG